MKKIIWVLLSIDILLLSFFKFSVSLDIDNVIENDSFMNRFVSEVFNSNEGNILVSPYSVEVALRMVMDGASGETKNELSRVLGERSVNDVTSEKVLVSNAMFVKDKYRAGIEKSFTNKILNDYGAEVVVDAFLDPHVINEWVSERTNKQINKIMDNISSNFALGLANAVFLDLEWLMPFSCNDTRKAEFIRSDGSRYNVEMMHDVYKTDSYAYFDNDGEKGIILPYREVDGKKYEFIGIIPNKDIKTYLENLNIDKIIESKRVASDHENVHLSLPRFSYEYSLDSFADILYKMGIHRAFNELDAEFYNIVSKEFLNANNYGNLYIGEAIHKTRIDVNEKGTKAAAVTFFGLFSNAIEYEEHKDVYITFDRPFIYLIREVTTNEVLFLGTVSEPREWKGGVCDERE